MMLQTCALRDSHSDSLHFDLCNAMGLESDWWYCVDRTGEIRLPGFLTIIPRARMGYESIAHEAEGRMGY